MAYGGEETYRKRTIEQREGINYSYKIKGEKGADENKHEEIVFPGYTMAFSLFRF